MSTEKDKAISFLGMSGGILMLVIAFVIVFPLLCCLGMVFFGAASEVVNPTPTPSFTLTGGGRF